MESANGGCYIDTVLQAVAQGRNREPGRLTSGINWCRRWNAAASERDGKVEPADAAFAKLRATRKEMPKTRDQMLSFRCGILPSPAKDILQAVASQPGAVAIEEVAGRLNLQPRGGHWNAGVSMLRLNDLVRTSPAGFELA